MLKVNQYDVRVMCDQMTRVIVRLKLRMGTCTSLTCQHKYNTCAPGLCLYQIITKNVSAKKVSLTRSGIRQSLQN